MSRGIFESHPQKYRCLRPHPQYENAPRDALKRVLPEALRPGEKEFVSECSKSAVVTIVHLIYQHKNYEGHARDYEFSGTSMREHWDSLAHPSPSRMAGALRDHARRNDPRPAPRGSDVTSTAGG